MTVIDVFVDEYGNSDIQTEKDSDTSFFIVTAVLVREDTDAVRTLAEAIRKKHFQTGEMKSSKVAGDDKRRMAILSELAKLKINTYSLAVDKKEIFKTSGLAYKPTFFKALNRKLYEKIYNVYDNVNLVADEHGTEKFMRGFEKYFHSHVPPDLFVQRPFAFRNSKDDVLLQVADFVSGSLARCLDPKKKSPVANEIAKLLAPISVGVQTWPPRRLPPPPSSFYGVDGPHDNLIRSFCSRQALIFLERNEGSEYSEEPMRVAIEVLQLLWFKVQFADDRAFVTTRAILNHLSLNAGINLSHHQLRVVIAKLRDADVIIASGKRGYKIPVSASDVFEFVTHAQSIVPPMLARLKRARSDLLMASNNAFDILSGEHFSDLRDLIDRT